MNAYRQRRRQFKTAKARYLETILQAIGQAGAAGYKSHVDTLFTMSHEIMGLTSPAKSDTMQTGAAKSGMKTEGNAMKLKVYYYENNGYNGILLVYGKRFISYDERIDGINVTRENIPRIVRNFEENGLDARDFETLWGTNLDTLIYGENAAECLNEQEYYKKIYEK